MLPFQEGNPTSPQRHKYSEMVGTHHPVGARVIVAGRFWADRGGKTTSRHGCEHAVALRRLHQLAAPITMLFTTNIPHTFVRTPKPFSSLRILKYQ